MIKPLFWPFFVRFVFTTSYFYKVKCTLWKWVLERSSLHKAKQYHPWQKLNRKMKKKKRKTGCKCPTSSWERHLSCAIRRVEGFESAVLCACVWHLFRKHSRVVCVVVKDCSKCCVAMPIVCCECTLFNVQQMIPDSICINIFYVKYVSFFLMRYCYGYYRCVNIYLYIFM